MKISERNSTVASVIILAASLTGTEALSADLTLRCSGLQHKPGTAYEQTIVFDLEFFWRSGRFRMFGFYGGVRKQMWEGEANEDANQIFWGRTQLIGKLVEWLETLLGPTVWNIQKI